MERDYSLPGTGAFGIPFFWTINLEIPGGIYCGLDAKHTSLLVVDFYRVAFEVMLQSDAFGPMSIMADDFTLEIAMWFFPQKTHNILTAENRDTAAYQGWVDPGQAFSRFEHDIRGPFTLVGRPIIRFPKRCQHGIMLRIQTMGNFVECGRPTCPQLLVHQFLSFLDLINPGKTVIPPLVTKSQSIHLSCVFRVRRVELPRVGDDAHEGRYRSGFGAAKVDLIALGARSSGEIARYGPQADLAGGRRLPHADAPVAPGLVDPCACVDQFFEISQVDEVFEDLARGGIDVQRDPVDDLAVGHDECSDGKIAEARISR